jgi:DNA-binding CsgD family transcriptional regulator
MRTRGRPRHPDILTPREWEVIELLRADLTNQEIADRLGISLDGAKYHVAQILTKLGISSRREAAAVADRNRGELIRRFAFLPLGWKLSLSKHGNSITSGGLVASVGVLLVLLFFSLRGQSQRPFDMYPGLYVLDLDSGKITRRVDLRDGQTIHYEWSPDGKRFIVHRRYVPEELHQLQVYEADSGSLVAKDALNFYDLKFTQLPDGHLGLVFWQKDDVPATDQVSTAPASVGIVNPSDLQLEKELLVAAGKLGCLLDCGR